MSFVGILTKAPAGLYCTVVLCLSWPGLVRFGRAFQPSQELLDELCLFSWRFWMNYVQESVIWTEDLSGMRHAWKFSWRMSELLGPFLLRISLFGTKFNVSKPVIIMYCPVLIGQGISCSYNAMTDWWRPGRLTPVLPRFSPS